MKYEIEIHEWDIIKIKKLIGSEILKDDPEAEAAQSIEEVAERVINYNLGRYFYNLDDDFPILSGEVEAVKMVEK